MSTSTTNPIAAAHRAAILEEIEMVLGPDWRQDFTNLRWITTPAGRPVLQADAMVMFGFMPDGKFAAVQRTSLNEIRIVIGSADHYWHKTREMTAEEREGWDRSLADYGIVIAPGAAGAAEPADS